MATALQVETVTPGELGPAERAAWAAWTAADPRYDSPYFHLRYTEIVSALAPHAGLAVLRQEGRLVGFLPFQRRGAEIQPLGAPLTDYHGPILSPGAEIDLGEVVRKLGGEVMSFTALTGPAPETAVSAFRHRMAADLTGGFPAYMDRRREAHSRFFHTRRRHEKSLVRDHGEIDFSYSRDPEDALDWIIENKRRQYRRTGQHDIFACGWTERLLRRLVEEGTPEFAPRFAIMRVGGEIASAEMNLTANGTSHLWFPAYSHAYARYGPGMLMTLRALEAAAAEGCRLVDFGPGEEPYKAYFCDAGQPVAEGRLVARPWRSSISKALAESYASGIGAKVGRRLHVVSACETSLGGWTRGLATVAASVARIKHRAALVLLAAPTALIDFAEIAPFA